VLGDAVEAVDKLDAFVSAPRWHLEQGWRGSTTHSEYRMDRLVPGSCNAIGKTCQMTTQKGSLPSDQYHSNMLETRWDAVFSTESAAMPGRVWDKLGRRVDKRDWTAESGRSGRNHQADNRIKIKKTMPSK